LENLCQCAFDSPIDIWQVMAMALGIDPLLKNEKVQSRHTRHCSTVAIFLFVIIIYIAVNSESACAKRTKE
jgi:hypothetical protein